VGIPVLDPVTVTVKAAEMFVNTGLKQSKLRKFAFPPQDKNEYIQ
jgi:allantoin racemase